MNKIYKVIYSKVRHCYVVVSEIARNQGKAHSSHTSLAGGTCVLALTLGLLLGAPGTVQAADSVDLDHGASAYYDDKGNLTIGDEKTVAEGTNKNGQHNTTIGTQTDTLRNVTEGDTKKDGQPLDGSNTILVDGEGKAHPLDLSTEAGGSTAVGYQNKAEGDNSTAIGNNAKITNKPVTYYVDADGKKTASPENAVWYKDASGNPTKVPQVFRDAAGNTTTTPQYVHTYTEKDTATGKDVTKTEITSDATKADQKDGQPVYNYQKTDNTPYLYTVTLYQAASNSIAAGTHVTAKGSNAVAVGYSSSADNSAVAIGDTAEAKENAVAMGKDTKATAEGSIALGKGSEASRDGGVAGWDPKTGTTSTKTDGAWKSGEGALSIGNGGASRQITNVAAGSEDSDAVNLAQLKNAMTHYYSVKTTAETDGEGNNNYLNDGATGDNALAAGVGTTASSDDATAVGTYATATASQATAIGRSASASSYQDTAIGYNAGAHGTYATAVGSSASATSFQSTAIGYNAGAHGSYAIAMGNGASATNTNAIAIGASANVPYENSTAVGASAKATDNQATAIGSSAEASGTYATALGNSASATSYESTAIGSGAGAHGSYAIAMGNGASATNSYAVAIGAGANAPSYQATALGNGASATSSQATAIGTGAGAHGTSATALGNGASANSSYATALGNGASANSSYATALGSGATAQSSDDTAIGSSAKASGGDATALGYNAQATDPNATALGSGASAYYHAIAIGAASASSSYALAAGDGANAQEYQAIALGYNAKSNVTGGVALGSSSTANVESGKTGLDPHTGVASTDTGTTWKSTLGAVSVGTVDSDGNATGTRQINGLAAGTKDTDAVNVAQLKAMETRINMHYYSVNSTLSGDGSNYDNTGASGTNALAAGPMASASGDNAVAIGYGAKAEGRSATAIGKNASATGQYAMAFGGLDTTDKQGHPVTMTNTASGASATAFGQGAQAKGAASLAFGHNTVAGVDGGGQQSVAFGEDTQALGGRSLAFGEKTIAKYNDSVAFGNDTRASSTGATAFGNRTRALSSYSTAWGNATVAADEESTAWGTDTIAGAKLDDNGAVTNIYTYKDNPDDKNEQEKTATEKMDVHGNLAYLRADGTTAGIKHMDIGGKTEKHDYVVLAGKDGNTYVRDYQGSLWKVNVAADGTVTVDTTAGKNKDGKVYNGKNGAKESLGKTTVKDKTTGKDVEVAITPDNVLTKAHEGTNGYTIDGYANATAFGYSTEASGDNATAWGNDTAATAAGATAFGNGTTASGVNATAWGESSTASGEAATAFGISSTASGKNSLAGLGGTAANENSIALGKDTKANNTTENAVSVAIGQNAEASGAQSLAIGFGNITEQKADSTTTTGDKNYPVNNTVATAKGAIAIGVNTASKGEHSVAMGSYTDAAKDSSVAIGFDTHTLSDSTVAIGSGTQARGRYSVAMGLSSVAGTETNDANNPLDGGGSVAIGYAASAEASRSIAIGTGANAYENEFTTAIGDSATASQKGSVAVGAGSNATRAAGNKEANATYLAAYRSPDNITSETDTTKKATWVATEGAVSVGGNTKYWDYDDNGNRVKKTAYLTRQITNVAAGSADTDAVNVAQLKAAGVTVTSADNSVGIKPTTDPTDYHTNYDLKVATATLTTSNGTVTNTNPKKADGKTEITHAYATGESVANAINNSGFTLTTSASNGTVSGTSTELINPGETVTLDAGKNIAITQAQNKITVALADDVNAQTVTVTGKDGKDGQIGLTGRDGKDGTVTTIIKTIGKNGTDGTDGKPGVDGTNITRVVYQDGQDGEAGTTTHTVATLDDGLKFIGDDNAATPVAKKLNETLQIRGDGTYDATTKKVADDGNIKTSVANGAVKVSLSDKINLHQNGSLTLGGDTNGTEKDGTDPITIRHFDDKTLDVITGVDKEGKFITSKEGKAGDYITGLDNKNWSVENPTYVSGRAATEDQLKVVSDAAKNATTAAGKHTLLTVNDKDTDETKATAGTKAYGNYAGADKSENLLIAAKEDDGQLTYNIKLNDQLNIGKKGADGTDGKVTVDTKGGTTVIIGHDGENGKDGKDGLFVRGNDGKDGKSGVSIIGPNGQTGDAGIDGKVGIAGKDGKDAVSISGKDGVGHIGLTGPKGADGKDGTSIDLSTDYGTKTLDSAKNTTVDGVEKASRIIYSDTKGDHEVATMDDGLKFIGDDNTATPIAKKLNETLQIRGDGTYDATTKKVADDGNIKTSVKDGAVKVSLSDKINLHQSGSLTLGGDKSDTSTDGTDPITIRHFDDKTLDAITGVDKEGKPITSKEGKAGDYITGLDNKTWNNESYVSGRAATEDQLHQVVNNLIGPNANGGFGLSANGSEVKQALGKTITINGDGTYGTDGKETKAGNISTSVEKGAVKVSLNTDLNIDSTTMEKKDADGNTITNKTTAEGSTMEKKDASGKTTASTTTNAGSLTIKNGDVTTTINENGVSTNKVTVGDKTTIDNGSATIGGVTINGNGEKDGTDQHASTITGLSNKTFDTTNTDQYKDSGRAATEAQLKEVYDKAAAHSTVTVNGKPSADGNLKLDTTTNQDGSTNYAISLNNDITLGNQDKNGKLTVKSQDGTKSITTNGEDGTLTFKDGSNETAIKAAEAAKGVDGTTDIKRISVDGKTVATLDDGMKFAGDSGEALKQKLNSTTNIKGGAAGELSDGNIGVVSDGNDTLTVKLARDIKGLDSVETKTVNADTVNTHTVNIAGDSSHSAITIKQGDVNMGGNTISGVAPGKVSPDSTEAVNGSQLYARDQAIGKLGNTVNHLDDKINRAGAGAAALAALHPQDFDPDDKWDFAAGYGNYHGASAAAIGAFYRPTEDVMVSVGGSMGGGENMVNAGVTFKLGQHNHVSNSRVAMAKEIRDLKATVGQLTQMVNQLSGNAGGRTLPLKKGDTLFPDVPKNHWAYDYVTKLAQAGMLEGYPDGEFKGDRMMTRYEFATVIYRAIMAGAAGNPKLNQDGTLDKLVDEFGDELQYIRIAVVERDKNGKPTIERVRTVEDDKKHHHPKEREEKATSQEL